MFNVYRAFYKAAILALLITTVHPFHSALGGEVTLKFKQLGDTHYLRSYSELMWSGVQPFKIMKDQYEAAKSCDELGGGARLPYLFEIEKVRKALGFGTETGYSDLMRTTEGASLICVVEVDDPLSK